VIGLLTASLSMMAQEIFNFGFESPSSALTVGKMDFVNFLAGDTHDSINAMAHSGSAALMLQNANTAAGGNYQRALKFRNLPLEPNTSYRVSFWVKGDNAYTLAGATTSSATNIRTRLEVGTENHDVNLVGAANKNYDYTFTGFDPANWVKKSAMFYFTNDEVQKAYYKTLNPDSAALPINYFLNLNVYNPGTYFIDDISVKKTSIKGITFNGDVIKVDFGYAINSDALRAGKDYSTAVLPTNCVVVKNDGTPLVVEAVELQATGFYIFLATDYLDDTANGKLTVSFTNPVASNVALKYTDGLRPGAWDTNSNQMVLDFANEDATYDMNMSGIASTLYSAPFLKSASPEDGSFSLPYETRTFKLLYSKPINCGTVTASLNGPNGTFPLVLTETGFSNSLTFKVKDSDVLSAMGEYFLNVKNISSEMGTPAPNTVVSLEYGIATAGVIDTLFNSEKLWAANANGSVPNGFKRITGGVVAEQNTSISSNRLFTFPAGGEYTRGIYLCYREGKKTDFIYGLYPEQRLHLKPGKYNFTARTNRWQQENSPKITFSLMGLDTVAIYTQELSGGAKLPDASKAVTGSVINSANFTITEEKDYLIDFGATAAQGWDAIITGKVLLIKTPSTSFLYSSNLNIKLASATTTLTSMDSSIYNGSDKVALATVITKYNGFTGTSPSMYATAIADIDSFIVKGAAYKAKVDAHFARIASYHANVAAAKTTIATYTGTKFAALNSFPTLINVVSKYDGLELTADDSLTVANDTLTYYNTLMKNWATVCIPALTFRLNKAITLAQKLKVPVPAADLLPAQAAMSDDDQVADALNAKITQYLYHNIAVDSLKFGSSMENAAFTDSIELTNYIKNPNFYTSYTKNVLDNGTFPGWKTSGLIDNNSGTANTNAGISVLASAASPIVDTYGQSLNNKLDYFEQVVTGLPVGVYNINFKARKGNPVNNGLTKAEVIGAQYFYVIHGTDTLKVDPWITQYPELPTVLIGVKNVKITDGTFKMGFHIGVYPGFTPTMTWGDPQIFMVGKDNNFVYTGVHEVATKAEVKEVQYYNIQGMRLNRPSQGLNIVKTIYVNGTFDVKKVMLKY
jgi:hypothetical protein